MSTTKQKQLDVVVLTEPERVLRWRLEQFAKLGCGTGLSERLAASKVDLRTFEGLLDSGCAPLLAANILL